MLQIYMKMYIDQGVLLPVSFHSALPFQRSLVVWTIQLVSVSDLREGGGGASCWLKASLAGS